MNLFSIGIDEAARLFAPFVYLSLNDFDWRQGEKCFRETIEHGKRINVVKFKVTF